MKIHSVQLRNVRHLRELRLDLSGPLTVIGGCNGAGKSTLQQSILAAMFFCEKSTRDSFVSQFDPESAPTVTLGLSRGDDAATIVLTRNLLDDKGEWREGGMVLKEKKQALKEIQKVLPISADAAALLLWGRQDDMPAVVESFPSDGHTLLTAATIQGSGRNPKTIIQELEKESDHARKGERGGQVVGSLIQARNKLAELTAELTKATSADAELCSCRQQLHDAKGRRDKQQATFDAMTQPIRELEALGHLLETALGDIDTREQMIEQESKWTELEQEISDARKELLEKERDLEKLLAQTRVARDAEYRHQIENLAAQITAFENSQEACAALESELISRQRPDASDVTALRTHQEKLKEANDKVQATGIRYELSATMSPRTLRIAEDGQDEREITLLPGQIHLGVSGRLTIEAEGVRLSLAGKEDIAVYKSAIQNATFDLEALLAKFAEDTVAGFLSLANRKHEIQVALADHRREMKLKFGNASPSSMKNDLKRLEAARADNKMTLKDQQSWQDKNLPAVVDLENWCSRKQGEISQARDDIASLEAKRPGQPTRTLHQNNLETIRRRAWDSAAKFKDADKLHRDPTKDLKRTIHTTLEQERSAQTRLQQLLIEARENVARLHGQLSQAQPHRALDAIQTDLEEAKDACHHEETRQLARALLAKRINEKMDALGAHVPVELGKKVTEHLARLTHSAVGPVVLGQDLAVARFGGNGAVHSLHPGQLSHGERHQSALAVKIAVARALSETTGPVFIILDDSLVTFDPERRGAAEDFLLDLVSDEKLQVILLTCHTDWAADWQRRRPREVNYVDLSTCARYYPPTCGSQVEVRVS